MADATNNYVQVNGAIVLTEVQKSFNALAQALNDDKGVSINIQQSYMSKYDVADELRVRVKSTAKVPSNITPSLDPNKTMEIIIAEGNYTALENYLNTLKASDYEPPLPAPFESAARVQTYNIPSSLQTDPRRTGRLVIPNLVEVLKAPGIQRWILNNGVLYGFLLYSDYGLYYAGLQAIQNKLAQASDKQLELQNIVTRFVKDAKALSQLSTTAQRVLQAKPPALEGEATT